MTLTRFTRLALTLAIALSASNANALTYNLTAFVDALQEYPLPPDPSPATGILTGTYDDVTTLLTWDFSYQNLQGTPTIAALYGPAELPFEFGETRVDIGVLSGNDLSSPIVGSVNLITQYGALKAAQWAGELLSNHWYVNLHSQFRTPGEIRGQIITTPQVIPEPGTLALLGVGLAGLAVRRRRPRC